MSLLFGYIKDIRNHYKRVPKEGRRLAGLPIALLFFFCPLLITLTIATWFDLKIFVATIFVIVFTFALFSVIVYMERSRRK